jgi:deazaflavin-dependent oxidoreductase (nitroreductase family)
MQTLLRAPTLLYTANVGWLLGPRFLCLTHIGRHSARRYRTVLEVIGLDPGADEIVVLAGRGTRADWYQNVQVNPQVEIVHGRRRFPAVCRTLDETDAVRVLSGYERRNRWSAPVLRHLLGRLAGSRYDGSDGARRRLVHQLPLVAIRPASPPPSVAHGSAPDAVRLPGKPHAVAADPR